MPSHPDHDCHACPELGLFWALPGPSGAWDIVAVSLPFHRVAEIGGFRTLEAGHVDLWRHIRRSAGPQVTGNYEDYPRGRVNWRREDQRFLLLLDMVLQNAAWIARIMGRFRLSAETTTIMSDLHYRSTCVPPKSARHNNAEER